MLAELVFVTRLLGLMSGSRPIDMQVDPSVHAVEILLDGERAGVVRGAPWRTQIDFGPELAPHELVAIARDAEGRELARDTQFVNVPRPQAEIGVLFERDRAHIRWQHIGGATPKKMTVKLGSRTLAGTVTRTVKLPPLPPEALNVLSIDLDFPDGSAAHRDVVFGGFSEEVPAELTATLVYERDSGRKDRAACFRADGRPVVASEVETGDAAVLVVRHYNPPGDQFKRRNQYRAPIPEKHFTLERTSVRFVWPIANGNAQSDLFMTSPPFNAMRGLRFLLLSAGGPKALKLRITDAVAVAGMEALREPRRRAVLLVLNGEEDQSSYHPEVVRRYLEHIGVPLYVWSFAGPVKNSPWGNVEDISINERLQEAVRRLEANLARQRIAWLPLNPYDALRVQVPADCTWEPLAR